MKNIWFGINAVIFFTPLYLIRFSLLGIPTTVLEIMIYILFLFWFFKESYKIKKTFKEIYLVYKERYLWLGIFLMFLGVLLSTYFSEDLRTSLGILKGFFIDPFLFFIILVFELNKQKEKNRIFFSYILSAFFVSLIGMFYFLNGSLTFDGRLNAFYESPNYLAMYITPAFLFLLHQLFFCKKENLIFKNKKFSILILFIILFNILLAKSFGAILGIFVIMIFLLFKTFRNKKYFKKRKIYIASIILFAAFSYFAYQKYEQIIFSEGRSSYHSRITIWKSSLQMVKNNPVFGIGPGTFQQEYLNLQVLFEPYLEWAVSQPHNTFLAFYLQTGVLGFLGFMIIFFWLVKKTIKDEMVFIFVIYFFCHSLADTLYWKNDLALIFFIVLAFVLGKQKNKGLVR